MLSTINGSVSSYSKYDSNTNNKFEISDELKDYIENSSNDCKKLLKSIKNLEKDGDFLSTLVSTNTDEESLTAYSNGRTNVKNLISSLNNLIKHCKNNSHDEKLQKLYKNLKQYTKKESDYLKNFGIDRKSDGSLKITDDTKFKYSIANGSFGEYILTQQNNNTFFKKLSVISKKISYDYSMYLSDETIQKVNLYNARNYISNDTASETSSSYLGSNFSAHA